MKTAHQWTVASMAMAFGLAGTLGCGTADTDTIVRISRQNNSGTYAYFREAVLGKKGKFKLGSVDQSGSKDVVELVSKTPSAIGFSGMGYATAEVKMLKLSLKKGEEGIAPTIQSAKDGSYPLARPLFIYTLGDPQGAVKHYLDWIKSTEGQKVVEAEGYVSNAEQPAPPADPPPSETINVEGSDTLVQVAGKWAEIYMEKYPQVNIIVQGGGSGRGIASLINGTTDLANCSREMKPEEKEKASSEHQGKPVIETIIGMDALAVYVHKDNPLDTISIEELASIYGNDGEITKWSQLTDKTTDAKE